MPWEFTQAKGLALLGLLAPLALLYVLKVRRERRVVPSIWLWQAALRDLSAEKPFQRLLPRVSLILEALALIALAGALAGPVVRSSRLGASRLALIVDVSASMGALEGGSTRLSLGVSRAKDVLSRVEPGTEIMLIAAGREPELISPFERDRARLEAALGRLAVREVEGQMGRALALAGDQLRQHGGGRIVLFTDAALADKDALGPVGLPLDVVQVGTVTDNTAIVRAEVSLAKDSATGQDRVEAFALVANFGRTARELFVTLAQRNVTDPVASRRIRLEPGERTSVVLSFESSPGDAGKGLEIEISPHDALVSDDRATLLIPVGKKLPVVIAPKTASPWLLRALSADPDLELFSTPLSGLTPDAVSPDALLVLDGACPEHLPGGDVLIVNPPAGRCRTLTVGERIERPVITSWNEGDPRLRFLAFEGVEVAAARTLQVEAPRDALVRSRDGVLIADVSSPGRSGTLVGFDVGESSWPLKASFVLFMRNVAELAQTHRLGAPAGSAHSGEPTSVRVPFDVASVDVEYPGGRRDRVRAREGLAVLPAATQVGFCYASWAGSRPGSFLLPVSLASEAESHIAADKLTLSGHTELATRPLESLSRLDGVLAAFALLLLLLDVAWLTRRPRAVQPPSSARASSAPRKATG